MSTDVVIIELEDGVSIQHKEEARNNLEKLLVDNDFGQRETAVRINRISTRHGLSDLLAIADLSVKPDLLVAPKVESADEMRLYDELLNDCNISSKLLILIESSKGLLNAHHIAGEVTELMQLCWVRSTSPQNWDANCHGRSWPGIAER